MKKIGKLSINPEKVIKNDELVNLKGGYEIDEGPFWVSCKNTSGSSCGHGFVTNTCDGGFYNQTKCESYSGCDGSYACV